MYSPITVGEGMPALRPPGAAAGSPAGGAFTAWDEGFVLPQKAVRCPTQSERAKTMGFTSGNDESFMEWG